MWRIALMEKKKKRFTSYASTREDVYRSSNMVMCDIIITV